jgi:DNA-directed RNA polymerases I, II, and III subunit RPABC3
VSNPDRNFFFPLLPCTATTFLRPPPSQLPFSDRDLKLYSYFPYIGLDLRIVTMASTGDTQLFDEQFTITNLDNLKYDRVARLAATSADAQTVMTLDFNTELYPCTVGETLHCVLASSLSLDGTKDDGKGWRDVGRLGDGAEATLADMFDYVCHGKIYKFEDGEDGQTM